MVSIDGTNWRVRMCVYDDHVTCNENPWLDVNVKGTEKRLHLVYAFVPKNYMQLKPLKNKI
jgi:hypothetical protein